MIEKKLSNLFETVTYKNGEMKVYVIDDGSTDETFQIARRYANSKNLANLSVWGNPENVGKAAILNLAFNKVKEDIVVVTDADAIWEENALSELIANFNDPAVGGVNGRLVVDTMNRSLTVKEEGAYRKFYDLWRRAESNMDSCTVFNGTIMAFRAELLRKVKVKEDTYTDDIDLAFEIRKLGYRSVYEPDAIAREFISSSIRARMKQEIRRARGLTQVFLSNLDMMGRFGSFGKVVYPMSFYQHIISPFLTLVILALIPFVIFEYPILLLAGLFFLIPAVATAVLGYVTRHFALVIGILIPKKGKWKPIRE